MIRKHYYNFIQLYSGIFRILCNSGIFRTVVYPEPWHIQNQKHIQNHGMFRTPVYSKSEASAEICQKSTMKRFAKILNGDITIFANYNYFPNISLPHFLLHEINIMK